MAARRYSLSLDGAGQVIPELVALTEQNPSLRDGALSSSLEEYAEAKSFCYYLDTKRLLPRRDVPVVQKNEYLGGVIDFTGEKNTNVELSCVPGVSSCPPRARSFSTIGELVRYAVVKATARDVEEVKRCKAMVEAISGELIQFDFRKGPLRRKFDAVKYNLRKLEVGFGVLQAQSRCKRCFENDALLFSIYQNTLYELSLVTNSGLTLQAHSVQEAPAPSAREDDE
ncbi:unnamed protein product [Phytophthora fragariaefolia]|uniref:Unnamed protein product n=1 Tax=Phytophthora fragariaefolia TaxID=1490495 RepID=A0A9W6TYN8_9STRA|nr:unnamed protein product [Phytophthora fragariaefolia]